MENIDKYIFDPKDPKKCKVYTLLLQILKDKTFATMLSPLFYLQLFEETLEKKFEEEIWDKPDNYDSMSFDDKVECHIKQNSISDLFKDNYSVRKEFTSFSKILGSFEPSNGVIQNMSTLGEYEDYRSVLMNFFNEKFHQSIKEDMLNSDDILLPSTNSNIILFIDQYTLNHTSIKPAYRSIMCITEEDYNNNDLTIPQNTHLLILKKRSDINILLNVLQNDLKHIEARQNYTPQKEISYISSLKVNKYFCIEDLALPDLKDQKEIYILGENGDGKTLILQSIILALKGVENGTVKDYLNSSDKINITLNLDDETSHSFSEEKKGSAHCQIIAYGVSRNRNDSDKKDESGYLTLFSSEQYLNNPVKWLQYLDYKRAKGESDALSVELAKEMLTDILDDNIKIEIKTDDVIFTERGTKVHFEQLAEGYKSILIWVCDLIQRLSEAQPEVYELKDYRATVLVDEIGLHLHPKWEYQVIRKLRSWFKNIQFIFTTHSPTVILGSSSDAVFFKLYKKNGITKVTQPVKSVKNLMANGVLTSPLFNNEAASAFSSEPENIETSDDFLYNKIHKAIHPITPDDISPWNSHSMHDALHGA